MRFIVMEYVVNMSLQRFSEHNLLPEFDNWVEAAEFCELGAFKTDSDAREAICNNFCVSDLNAPAVPAVPANGSIEQMLANALSPFIKAPVSEPDVIALIKKHATLDEKAILDLIKKHSRSYCERTEIVINGSVSSIAGKQHAVFPKVLFQLSCGNHVFLYGPAGTGKSKIAENVAEVLGRRFFPMSICMQSTKAEFFGFVNAVGNYQSTPFREAFENGGIFLLDELDAGNPNVVTSLNSALANKMASFPDSPIPVKQHKDFLCVSTANTFGTGADRVYVGRTQLDGASLNRFVKIAVNYDEQLERELFGELAVRVQAMRKKFTAKEQVIISMRNMFQAQSNIDGGHSMDEAIKDCIIESIPENFRDRL